MNTQRVRALVDIFWNGTNRVAVPAGSYGAFLPTRFPTPDSLVWVSWEVAGHFVYKQASPNEFEYLEDRREA